MMQMPRAPFQVLVLPYRRTNAGEFQFALFQRADDGFWQGIAGGGEDDETPLQAARRESLEEARIPAGCPLMPLQTMCMVSVTSFSVVWPPLPSGEERSVIPEFAFGVAAEGCEIVISCEHYAFAWLSYSAALAILHYDSNRTALWELNQRLQGKGPRD